MMKQQYLFFLLVLLFLGSCGRKSGNHEGKTAFRYNEAAGITSLDPAFARNQANIWAVNQIYIGLVQLDSSLAIKPCLARDWEISEDGKTYTFHLRNDVIFHDDACFPNGKGRSVSAQDVEFSLKRLADSKLASPGAWVMGYVDAQAGHPEVNALNDSTLSIQLSRPFPPFLGMLSMQYCSVLPREAIQKYGHDFRSHPVGAGPFRFAMGKEGGCLISMPFPFLSSSTNSRLFSNL